MPDPYLTIPLNQPNPARQRLWRAAWLAALVGVGVALGILVYRTILFRNHAVNWPNSATLAIRLPKTPENLTDAAFLQGLSLAEELPLNIHNEFLRSHNEIILFLDHHGQIVGLATDRAFSEQEQKIFSLYNAHVIDSGTLTTISPDTDGTKRRIFTLWNVWPQFDGAVSLLADNKVSSAPLILTEDALITRGNFAAYQRKSQLSLDNATILASFSAPADLAAALTPDIPAIFPGLQIFTENMEKNGFSLLLGQDNNGLAYAISLENSSFSPENLGEISKELAQTPRLSRQDWTINFQTYQELRGEPVEVIVSHDADLNRVVATGSQGIVRATQSATTTIISNRQSNIGRATVSTDPCLTQATSFLAPQLLTDMLPPTITYQPRTLDQLLRHTSRISWSENLLKVCW